LDTGEKLRGLLSEELTIVLDVVNGGAKWIITYESI